MLTPKRQRFSACNNLRNHTKRKFWIFLINRMGMIDISTRIMVNRKFLHTEFKGKKQVQLFFNGYFAVQNIGVAVALNGHWQVKTCISYQTVQFVVSWDIFLLFFDSSERNSMMYSFLGQVDTRGNFTERLTSPVISVSDSLHGRCVNPK